MVPVVQERFISNKYKFQGKHKMKLITEEIESVEVLTETVNGKKSLYITGPFLQAETVNRNGRLYPYSIMEREVKRYTQKYVNEGRAVGELCHPISPSINLDRVAIKIISLVPEGKNFIGKAKILESTPMGKIAKALLDEGVRLGVSSRGVGSLRQNPKGYNEVCEDFMLATAADIVHDPSAPDAYVSSVMENAEWIYDAVRDEWIMEQTKKKINTLVDQKILEEYKLSLFNEFLNSL